MQDLPSLTDEIRDNLTTNIELDELKYIIKQSANNKSPGLDGLTYEFYKATFHIIQNELLEVFQCQLDRNNIISSNKKGVTRLLPKVQGAPRVDELRPITLLNCDYKLLSKWFVLRMKPALPCVIRSGQLCTVGGRNILFGVSNILSSIAIIKEQKTSGCLINLDFFKAYDCVYLGFLLKVLDKMNFGTTFVSWVKMLHEGASTSFILLSLTTAIEVCFSIRQGDPLAMLLYVIYLEPLLVNLERVLSGLQLRRPLLGSGPLDAYCDDLNIMTNNLADFPKIDNEVRKFEMYSGAILSRSRKSKVIGFGKWSRKEDWPIPWLACEKSLKVFGIYISDNYSQILKLNWDHRLEKFKKAILSWTARTLTTMQQRIEIVKTFALSRAYYVASILPIGAGYVKNFETIIRKFIWKGPFSVLKVAFNELKNKKLEGGLQVPCISSMGQSLLTSQCLRLLRSKDRRC